MSAAQLTDQIDLSRRKDPVEIVTPGGVYVITPRSDNPFVDVSTPSGHTYENMRVNPDANGIVYVGQSVKIVTPRPAPRLVNETDNVTEIRH